METKLTSLSDKLKQLRAEYGLSFQLLSERSYVDVAYLHRIETGRVIRPSRDILIRIAFGLGLDLEIANELITAAGHVPLLRHSAGSAPSAY